jgi:hypothetical protein
LGPCLADINRMRNDVIHRGRIASRRNTGRCEVLHWFKVGEPIHVMPVRITEFMDYLGLVEPSRDIGGGAREPKGGFSSSARPLSRSDGSLSHQSRGPARYVWTHSRQPRLNVLASRKGAEVAGCLGTNVPENGS